MLQAAGEYHYFTTAGYLSFMNDKDFELLFNTGYRSNTLMRVHARKTNGCASGRCLLDGL